LFFTPIGRTPRSSALFFPLHSPPGRLYHAGPAFWPGCGRVPSLCLNPSFLPRLIPWTFGHTPVCFPVLIDHCLFEGQDAFPHPSQLFFFSRLPLQLAWSVLSCRPRVGSLLFFDAPSPPYVFLSSFHCTSSPPPVSGLPLVHCSRYTDTVFLTDNAPAP